jgi:hypothetical protein
MLAITPHEFLCWQCVILVMDMVTIFSPMHWDVGYAWYTFIEQKKAETWQICNSFFLRLGCYLPQYDFVA